MIQIAYLAHDLTDPAVHRRVAMLAAGGATVRTAGLSRGPAMLPGAMVLGRSEDARLGGRVWSLAGIAATGRARLAEHLGQPDVLVARNLEMLALAVTLLPRFRQRPRLVYECLDIHRLLVGSGPGSVALRSVERGLAPFVDLVLTSSPAFVSHHLGRVFGNRIAILENRVLDLDPAPMAEGALHVPPWRIGWFGALRCIRSLELLAEAAEIAQGEIDVVLRGRPSPAIFGDLSLLVRDMYRVRFDGPYDPSNLREIYGQVHFAWCVDFYEAGANSEWLLPNRLYESVHHGVVPIALAGTEAGRMLARHGIGILLDDAAPATLAATMAMMSPEAYRTLLRRQQALPRGLWSVDRADCRTLVKMLAGQPDLTAAGCLSS
jgi:glycosyltransferase involved in cell wall biosynthesis